jgi:hypothetical protein
LTQVASVARVGETAAVATERSVEMAHAFSCRADSPAGGPQIYPNNGAFEKKLM